MKSIFFEQHGEIDVLRFADLEPPRPGAGEVLVKVRAVALNHLDIWVRRGWQGLKLSFPHISGSDIAGEIVDVNGATQWAQGTRVVINPGVITGEDEWVRRGEDSVSPGYRIIGEHLRGGLAEYVVVPSENVFKLPDHVTYEEGCAPLLVGTTVWRMLFHRAALQPGESVLVVGSGGGVNSLAIQLAATIGATVYALCGDKEKAKRAVGLGATAVIDYRENPQWHVEIMKLTKGRGVDVVIDNVGADTFTKSIRAARRGGRIVTVGNTSGAMVNLDNRFIFTKQLSIIGSTMGSRQDFIDVMQFLWARNMKPPIDCIEPLKNGINMIKRLEDGKQFGKIVLVP